MQILWMDAFHGGSHAAVAQGYARHSRHRVELLTLPQDGGWRWRMRGAAVTFARALAARPAPPDLLVATDMLDLATLLGLARRAVGATPTALYMHENQLTYPLPPGRQRDLAFPWANYTAALAADMVLFNSAFHRDAWLAALPQLPGRFHDYRELDLIDAIRARSHVLYPGIDLAPFDREPPPPPAPPGPPIILWNSRWEYDKAPEEFFDALRALEQAGVDFRVIVAGKHIDPRDERFLAARAWLGPRAHWWGYAPDAAAYRALLRQADIVVSTAIQEFFGIAVLEAIYAGCVPVLPRRLSYPELLPPEHHADLLYDEATPLAERLLRTIAELPRLRALDLRPAADAHRWERAAPRYDALLAGLAGAD